MYSPKTLNRLNALDVFAVQPISHRAIIAHPALGPGGGVERNMLVKTISGGCEIGAAGIGLGWLLYSEM